MKRLYLYIAGLIFLSFLIILIGCKKDDDEVLPNISDQERIKELVTNRDGLPLRKIVYHYESGKIKYWESFLSSAEKEWILFGKVELTYESDSKYTMTGYLLDSNAHSYPLLKWEMLNNADDMPLEGTYSFYDDTRSGWMHSFKYKAEYLNGNIKSWIDYSYMDSWEESSKAEYGITGQNITRIDYYYKGEHDWDHARYWDISYSNNLPDEAFAYSNWDGWQPTNKLEYVYTNQNVRKLTRYSIEDSVNMTVGSTIDFEYDENDNCIYKRYTAHDVVSENHYTYESGIGNYDAVMGNYNTIVWFPTIEPIITFKSSSGPEIKIKMLFPQSLRRVLN